MPPACDSDGDLPDSLGGGKALPPPPGFRAPGLSTAVGWKPRVARELSPPPPFPAAPGKRLRREQRARRRRHAGCPGAQAEWKRTDRRTDAVGDAIECEGRGSPLPRALAPSLTSDGESTCSGVLAVQSAGEFWCYFEGAFNCFIVGVCFGCIHGCVTLGGGSCHVIRKVTTYFNLTLPERNVLPGIYA